MLVLALHVQGLKGKPKQCHFMCSVVSVKLIVHLSQVHFCTLDSIDSSLSTQILTVCFQ